MNTEAFVVLATFTIGGIFVLAWTPIGRALAERIRGKPVAADDQKLAHLRDDLQSELERVRLDVAELTERVDFAERMLSQQRESERLPPKT